MHGTDPRGVMAGGVPLGGADTGEVTAGGADPSCTGGEWRRWNGHELWRSDGRKSDGSRAYTGGVVADGADPGGWNKSWRSDSKWGRA